MGRGGKSLSPRRDPVAWAQKVEARDFETDTVRARPPPLYSPAPCPGKLRPLAVTRPLANGSLPLVPGHYLQVCPDRRVGSIFAPRAPPHFSFPVLGILEREARGAVGWPEQPGPTSPARKAEETEQLVPHCFLPPDLLLFSISIAL